eukprot:1586023-Rhodomonas_salina.1
MAERGALGLTAAPRRHEPVLSPAVIRNRLRELQALCTDVEAMLFVSGVDGQYNEGSRKVLNFLLCGYSGNDILQSTRTHPDLEDASAPNSPTCCCKGITGTFVALHPVRHEHVFA